MPTTQSNPTRRVRCLRAALALLIATAIWLPALHLLFRPSLADFRQPHALAPQAQQLAARHLKLWEDPARRQREIARMRRSNAEWDFMGRTYLVLALSDMAMDDPSQQSRYLTVIDAIIDETLSLETDRGMYFFLMDYARRGPYLAQPARSTFVDGEIAMMLAARQMVSPKPAYAPVLAERIDLLIPYMSRGPVLCGESYPNECWMFCNALAIAAIQLSDRVDGRDHSAFIQRWLATIKSSLVDQQSGLLVSSFTYDGHPLDGPEGSSIWMVAHCLKVVDPAFAADQYRRARQQIGVPIVGASAGSSGLAVLGAATFGDDVYLRHLLTTLEFAAFPVRGDGELRYAASNQVGDAVLLYAMVQGPLWERATRQPEKRP